MSRVRVRPTREETRERLFEAAAEVFEEQGIGAASVEAIAAAAGFTRGAFYSNFASKDELVTAMLADHAARTVRRHLELLAAHRDPADFVAALWAMDRSGQDPLGRSPLLHIELILYAARTAEHRGELAETLRARREMVAAVLRGTELARGAAGFDAERLSTMLLALEDGLRLHRLVDPRAVPPDSFVRAVADLQRALGR